MAKTLEDWQEIAQLAQELGDVDTELEAREAIESMNAEQGFMSAAGDTAKFLGQSAATEIGAGLTGLTAGAVNQSAETGLLSKLGIDPLDRDWET